MEKELIINGIKYVQFEDEPEFEEKPLSKVAKVGDYVSYPIEYENITDEFNNSETKTGWRVLKNDGVNVTLVSAGCPIKFKHEYGKSKESISKMDDLCNDYLDDKLGMEVRALTKSDIDKLLKCDSWDLDIIDNDLVSLDCRYWLASQFDSSRLYYWYPSSRYVNFWSNFSLGVRPVVVLKSGVKAIGKTDGKWDISL